MDKTLDTPRLHLEQVIARHGRWPTLRALIALLLRANRPPPLDPKRLSAHLRRDLGIERPPPSPTYRDFL